MSATGLYGTTALLTTLEESLSRKRRLVPGRIICLDTGRPVVALGNRELIIETWSGLSFHVGCIVLVDEAARAIV